MSGDDYTPQRLADRAEIMDRLCHVAQGVDRMDWDLVRSAYHPDAVDEHGIFSGSVTEFVEFAQKRHQSVLSSMHHLTNVLIEFIDEDTALVDSYVIVWQSLGPENRDLRAEDDPAESPEPAEFLTEGRYVDEFRRRDDAWRIQHRRVLPELALRHSAQPLGAHDGTGTPLRRGKDDFYYQKRDALRSARGPAR
jgi:hypothetical protein